MATKDRKCRTCDHLIYRDNTSGQCRICLNASLTAATPQAQVVADRFAQSRHAEHLNLKRKYEESLHVNAKLERDINLLTSMKDGLDTFLIEPKLGEGTSEGTVVMVASDWHSEELVGKELGGLNTFNPDIAQKRVTQFFQSGLRLIKMLQQDIKINKLVLALLGDFITNQIHGADNAETNAAQPMHAIVTVRNMIISGIEFLLNHSDLELVIPCASGNHARTTLKTRFASENGHSLEYLMYVTLADYFRSEPRVTFIIPEGMHSYMKVYDTTIRFHHGHAVKYGGGVGGIYIPVNKAISQWNKGRHADLDIFGHFHQLRDGGNFLCNGSLIGYNSFALSIKADYEPPKQILTLIDKKRGRTCTWPIIVNEGESK